MSATPSQTIGPFFAVGLEHEDSGGPLRIAGTVFDGEDAPVDDALIELWDGAHFARALTDSKGRWSVATEEPVGAYIAVSVFARGLLQRLVTRVYLDPAAAPHPTLIARKDGNAWEWDIHLQGGEETVFFAL
jgi:protocatechuate 3,4-dioxygenase, alpha subunit